MEALSPLRCKKKYLQLSGLVNSKGRLGIAQSTSRHKLEVRGGGCYMNLKSQEEQPIQQLIENVKGTMKIMMGNSQAGNKRSSEVGQSRLAKSPARSVVA